MRADIVCVGTGYLTGMIQEKNGTYLAGRMAELDVNLRRLVIVGEEKEEIKKVLEDAYRCVDIVVISGGIGYGRCQDLYAEIFGKKLLFSEKAFMHMKAQIEKAGAALDEEQLKAMAMFPEDALVLDNYSGYVPGYILEKEGKTLIILPAEEKDLQSVFEDDVVGYIFKHNCLGKFAIKIILNEKVEKEGITGILEHLGNLVGNDNPNLDIIKENGDYVVKVKSVGPTSGDAMILANLFVSDCCNRIGKEYIKDIKEDVF